MTLVRSASLVLLVSGSALMVSACGGNDPNTRFNNSEEEVVDETAPTLDHEYDPSPREFGVAVFIGADVVDDSAIRDVKIWYQRETDGSEWSLQRMAPLSDAYYEGTIPGKDVSSGGIRYYIEAEDEFGNTSCLPEACSAEAWHFPVVPPRD